jgi:hypothetical protein
MRDCTRTYIKEEKNMIGKEMGVGIEIMKAL